MYIYIYIYIYVHIYFCVYRKEMEVTPIADVSATFAIASVFTVCLAGGIAVGFLLVWHMYLIATNQTTVEFYINMHEKRDALEKGKTYKNPFDKGWRKNLLRVFGDDGVDLLCLYFKLMSPMRATPPMADHPSMPPVYASASAMSMNVTDLGRLEEARGVDWRHNDGDGDDGDSDGHSDNDPMSPASIHIGNDDDRHYEDHPLLVHRHAA